MRVIRKYYLEVIVELGDTSDGPLEENDLDKQCRDHLTKTIETTVLGSGKLPTKGILVQTGLDNVWTDVEQAELTKESNTYDELVDKWEKDLEAAIREVESFPYDANDIKGIYNFKDCIPANFNVPYIQGLVKFTSDGMWLQHEVENFASKVYENPTFLDIVEVFETALRYTGDTHHVFYEGLNACNNGNANEDGIVTYNICTGS